jgi:hypothetical protein
LTKTSASFCLLSLLHILALTTKGNTYDFYQMLEKMTNNMGLQTPKFRYKVLLRMTLQWRHLKMLKRGGRSHDLTGIAGMEEGELVIECLSCLLLGKNLPEGWEDAPESHRLVSFISSLINCC